MSFSKMDLEDRKRLKDVMRYSSMAMTNKVWRR